MRQLNLAFKTLLLLSLFFSCGSTPTSSTDSTNSTEEMVGMDGAEETATTTYDIYQQTFVMAMLSNMTGSKIKTKVPFSIADAEKYFETNVKNTFNNTTSKTQMQEGGSWTLVWGPEVIVADSSMSAKHSDYINIGTDSVYAAASQTMFVAQKGDQYIVAIAGTNSHSKYDIWEDSHISTLVASIKHGIHHEKTPWPYLDLPKGSLNKVTPGTVSALKILFSMQSKGNTVAEYLATLAPTATITVTGHSLGGGLTPAVGLALFHQQTTLPGASSLNNLKHQIYPIAAPDIGTESFVTAVGSVFPKKSTSTSPVYQQWNQKIWNSNDIVPRAWSKKYLKSILTIYGDKIKNPGFLKVYIDNAYNDNDAFTINPYATMDSGALGQFTEPFITPANIPNYNCDSCANGTTKKDKNINTISCPYFTEILHQHIPAYFQYFKIDNSVLAPPNINACAAAKSL